MCLCRIIEPFCAAPPIYCYRASRLLIGPHSSLLGLRLDIMMVRGQVVPRRIGTKGASPAECFCPIKRGEKILASLVERTPLSEDLLGKLMQNGRDLLANTAGRKITMGFETDGNKISFDMCQKDSDFFVWNFAAFSRHVFWARKDFCNCSGASRCTRVD